VATGRREELGKQLVAQTRDLGGDLTFVRADVGVVGDCEASLAATVSTYGRIDVLINMAGIEGEVGDFHTVTEESWDTVMDINLKGTAFCCRYAIPHMIQQGGGVILNIGSINAIVLGSEGDTATRTKEGMARYLRGPEQELGVGGFPERVEIDGLPGGLDGFVKGAGGAKRPALQLEGRRQLRRQLGPFRLDPVPLRARQEDSAAGVDGCGRLLDGPDGRSAGQGLLHSRQGRGHVLDVDPGARRQMQLVATKGMSERSGR
jgi:hypothetical protein